MTDYREDRLQEDQDDNTGFWILCFCLALLGVVGIIRGALWAMGLLA